MCPVRCVTYVSGRSNFFSALSPKTPCFAQFELRSRAALLFFADDYKTPLAARQNFDVRVANFAAMKEVAALARNF